jgi:penicillin-binding protein 2
MLAARMGWLAVAQNEKYTLLAESNRVNLTLLPPRRGWIIDRTGRPLALNRTSFRVDIIPDRLQDEAQVLGELQQLMKLDGDALERIREDIKKSPGFQPVVVAEGLDWDTYAAVTVRASQMPGVAPAQSFTRFYPEGAGVGHLLGYVGAATAEEYRLTRDPLLITPGFKVGKAGIEKQLDSLMRGEAGAKRTEVTARGKLVRELATKPDIPGKNVKLTIDVGLQAYASRRLGNESGSAVVIDCKTGGILALTSMPCFDPNSFSDGIGRLEWKMLQEDDHIPMLNKALQGLYPPGSTLKPMAAIALQMAGVDPNDTVFCPGGYRLGDRTFRCLGHHGSLNMEHAIMKSCNTYFYSMARRVGYDKIAPIARELGLGQLFDLPFPSQRYGTVPDSAWKKKKYGKDWTISDSLTSAIGQGYVIASPFQLAVMAARIASGRKLVPHLFQNQKPVTPALPFMPEHLAVARKGMELVMQPGGTGARSQLRVEGDVKMAGKTGTAQVRGIKGSFRGQSGAWKHRDHGLFVFFAPVDNPQYAGAVVIEHGLGGARAAAPVAKDIMTYMFDPEQAMTTLIDLERGWGGDVNTRMAKKQAAWMAANDPVAKAAAEQAEAEAALANTAQANNAAAQEDEPETPVKPATKPAAEAPVQSAPPTPEPVPQATPTSPSPDVPAALSPPAGGTG